MVVNILIGVGVIVLAAISVGIEQILIRRARETRKERLRRLLDERRRQH
jgi:hypothetical protein